MPDHTNMTDPPATSSKQDAGLLKRLKQQRTTIKSKCTRACTYLEHLDVENTSVIELRSRVQKFNTTWDEFQEIQREIEAIETDEQYELQHESERASFEDKYFTIVTKFESTIEEKVKPVYLENANINNQVNADPAILQMPGMINSSLKLPRVNMPIFSGKYDEWMSFKNMFHSMIQQNATLPAVQKMQYLISALKGEAYDIVSSLEVSAMNYEEAWQLLVNRYDDQGIIVGKHIKALFELPTMLKDNHESLRKLLDNVQKHLRALKALRRPTEHWGDLIIHMITTRLDHAACKEWELQKGNNPTHEQLFDFLSQRCRALEAAQRTSKATSSGASHDKNGRFKGTVTHAAVGKGGCAYCQREDHFVYNCCEFLALNESQRIKEARERKLCLNCLRSTMHQAKKCSSGGCRKCSKRHNTLLHLGRPGNKPTQVTTEVASTADTEKPATSSVNNAAVHSQPQVLLATALVNILDNKGKRKCCRALLDSGSQSCFITNSCCKRLGLEQLPIAIPVWGLGAQAAETRNMSKITIRSRIGAFEATLNCLVIDKITQALPSSKIKAEALQIPRGITLADPEFNEPASIDLLLGAEIFFELLCVGRIKLSEAGPVWQKTLLGWIVSGNVTVPVIPKSITLCNVSTNELLHAAITKFWQIENATRKDTRTPDERICEEHFGKTYKRNNEGRFIVTLPIKQEILKQLGESRESALARLQSLERRLHQKPDLRREYKRFIDEYLKLGHMREVSRHPHYYMPHHCVVKNSTTTKLRVVFDASSKSASGISLNDALLPGPVVQSDLFFILIRFRSFRYTLTADAEKMYRQVLLDENQTSLQRILWRDDPDEKIKTYELLTLTYGTASAAFLATKVIQQLARLGEKRFPKGTQAAENDFYVDDFISGANTIAEARDIRDQVIQLLSSGGFKLRKWASNSKQLLKDLPIAETSNQVLELDKDGCSKTLGIIWNPAKDVLQYNIIRPTTNVETCTKRSILSGIAQIFDPLGLLGPVTITAKILLQKIWKLQLEWDESTPTDTYTQWLEYINELPCLKDLNILRWVVKTNPGIQFELHGFCDASQVAYGACMYARCIDSNRVISVQLLCAKARVAPLKTLSIPKLELCGAQLLVQLMARVKDALGPTTNKLHYRTDSTIVLHWIKANDKKLPVFVSHRVGEIQNSSAAEEWGYVKTSENPADLISRGVSPSELNKRQLWWHGPHWLSQCNLKESEAEQPVPEDVQPRERQDFKVVAIATLPDDNLFDKFSTFTRLVRVVATCLKFIRSCRGNKAPLNVNDLQSATRCLVRRVQQTTFMEEMHALRNNKLIGCNSKLKQLNPFMDNNGLIRVGGRLEHANLPQETKHPYILPQKSRLTRLIIEHEHRQNLHTGVESTLAAVRQRFWPLRTRGAIKKILRECVTCFKARPRLSEQMMGNLPAVRVTASRPFTNTGIDFCGPLCIREGSRKNAKHGKAYVAVFVCMAVKAVHLEVVSNLSTDAFLNAFKRFIGRRGKPSNVYTDNGTNFVGANRELGELARTFGQEEGQTKLSEATAMDQINWHFIPPRAPHFGGLWEAAVKAFKTHFYKITSGAALTFEEMTTLATQIEAILNSRPLMELSSDPTDYNYVSAGHFLIGSSLTSYPEIDLTPLKINRLSRWQHLEQMRQHFWRRWSSSYLLQLQNGTKWQINKGSALKRGQLVLCREDGLPPLKWITGRVLQTFPGSDGIVRTASIKTASGVIKRPAAKMAVLPFRSESVEEDENK